MTVIHTVAWKSREGDAAATALLPACSAAVKSLVDAGIDGVEKLVAPIHSNLLFAVALRTTFNISQKHETEIVVIMRDRETLPRYLTHPTHVAVVELIKQVFDMDSTLALDFDA
ncbi:hypothetical protein HK405_014820 [Cladochytrium tenue]|nr:hypothetical protein HK405_014820 [Cladochytrium tenue]